MKQFTGLRCMLSALALACAASPAWAQTPPPSAPFAGLFGGQSLGSSQSLVLGGSLFAVYQQVRLPADQEAAVLALDPRFQESGTFEGVSTSLTYAYNRRTANSAVSVGGQGSAAGYSSSPERLQLGFGGNTALSTRLTRAIDLSSSVSASYSPFYSFSPLADPSIGVPVSGNGANSPLGPEFNFAAAAIRNVDTGASVRITGAITKKSSVYSDVTFSRQYFLDDGSRDFWRLDGRAGFSHRIARSLGFHAGYTQGIVRSLADNGALDRTQGFDFGLDFGDSTTLQLTRRTRVTLAAAASSAYSSDNQTHYALTGNAGITHTIGRTWSTGAGYVRSFGFSSLFRDAVLTDSVTASLGGRIAPRVSLTSGAGWSRGRVGFNDAGYFTTYSATSNLQITIVRMLSAYAQYGYYRYRVPPGSTTLGLLSTFARQTVSAGLTMSVPIFNNVRVRS